MSDGQCYAKKRKEWLVWLTAEDSNSIAQQMYSMIWDAAVFRVVNEALLLAEAAPDGGVQRNGMVHRLLEKGFYQTQSLAIRRLLDRGAFQQSHAAQGPKGVYSLRGLLDDIEKHSHIMTRSNMLTAEEMPYDYKPVRKKRDEYHSVQVQSGKRTYGVPPELDWEGIVRRHEEIDALCGVRADERTPTDSVRVEVVRHLQSRLGVCSGFLTYTDKYLAHAATPESRKRANAHELELSLGGLWKAQQSICEVLNFTSVYLLGDNQHGGVAVPQYDHFKYIDKPLVAPEKVQHLHDTWEEFDRETRQWTQQGLKGLMREMQSKGGCKS